MNYYQAHAILDRVKDGTNYSPQIVLKALEMVGDARADRTHEGLRGKRMDEEIQKTYDGNGRCPSVVAKNVIRHSQVSWGIGISRPAEQNESAEA
ncbi:hypothetical protein EBZ39_01985 [bacterium]|nr:hypothetical protein [bacterium]